MRTTRYQAIADELRHRIEQGSVTAGQLLPSEAGLSEEFGASRVTIRRALELLREAGLVESRQGFGWLVATEPVRQGLAELGTIEGQLSANGIMPERRVLEFAFRAAPRRAAEVLGVDRVLEVTRCNLADGEPFARVTVWCPEELGRSLSRDDVEATPFYDLLGVEIAGADQTIGAAAASSEDAEILSIPVGSPVLVCERVTRTPDGNAILLSEHVFPGHRTVFSADLPYVEPNDTPAGLRLVE